MKKLDVLFTAFLIFAVASLFSVSGLFVSLALLAAWTILKKQENTRLAEELEMAIDQHTRAVESYEEAVKLVKGFVDSHNSANEITKTRFNAIEEQIQNIKAGNALKFGGK
jgi:uncharacterized protein YdeI (YjbR/CyaY-like superfamily)